MIKNVKFVEEVSQEFDKDDEIVVVCALSYSIFFYESSSTKFWQSKGPSQE